MIRLTTLGTARLTSDDGSLDWRSGQQPKRLALLAYLAVARPRGAHRRDTVLGLLWPEMDQHAARSALRQALHGLRKSLGADAIVSRGMEAIELDRSLVSCDIWDLEAASATDDHARVLELFDGDLLAGLFVADAPAFDEWASSERARLRAMVARSAWAVGAVRVATDLAGFDEAAIRRGMTTLARAGDRAAALDIYERFADTLRRELDTEPAGDTQALATELRRHSPASSAPTLPVTPQVVAEPQPYLVVRAPARRIHRVAAAVALAALATVAAARLAPSADSQADPRRVSVLAFANESPVAALDTLARAATSEARASLASVLGVDVVDSAAVHPRAGTIVRGFVRAAGDSVKLGAEVIDVTSGAIVRTVSAHFVIKSSLTPLEFGGFMERLRTSVATALYPGWGASVSQPPSYAAYRAFVAGMRAIKAEAHLEAIEAFKRGFAEDSSFTIAGLLAGTEFYQLRMFAAADSLARAVEARRASLPELDAHLLDWLRRSLAGDRLGARAAMQAIVGLAPASDMAWLQLAIDNVETGRPDEALAALDHIDPAAEFGESWASYWATRIEALHLLGRHARELDVARAGLRQHPDLRILENYELRAMAALGRVREVADRIALLGASDSASVPTTMRQAALELAAHGHAAAAHDVLRQARDWYLARPAAERSTLAYRTGYARTLFLFDEREGARAAYQSLLDSFPICLDCVGALGVLAARSSQREEAGKRAAVLGQATRPYMFGRNLYWMGRIAAAEGDQHRATRLVNAAFAAGTEFDVLTHTDPDLINVRPDSIFLALVRAKP